MLRHLKSVILAICLFLPLFVTSQNNNGDQGSLKYLEKTFPKLTSLYNSELRDCHTHYIFAVDVSGSMIKYDEIVTPALQAFVQALPAGEMVSIIPFGSDAKENTPGLCTTIRDEGQKQVLNQALSTLYINDGYSKEFRRNTDVNKAIEAINKAILNNQEAQMNVVVIITDFLNDLPNVGEQKLHGNDLDKLNKDFDNVTDNTYTRVVAMQLPKAGTGAGFCLDQLQESVFCNTSNTRRFDIIQAIKDKTAISHWFEQLSRDIMTEKLKAVIQLDNERNLHPSLQTKMDIDGNVTADISWTPNKLYQQIAIEATNTDDGSDYLFKNNEKVWQTTTDTDLVGLKLGKLVNKHWGLRKFDEALNIGMSLPTDYEDELKKLSIDKPIPATTDRQSGWLFTFFLPFWLTVALALALIIYIILVIKAIMRNSSEKFEGDIIIKDPRGNVLKKNNSFVSPGKFLIGKGGVGKCNVPDAEWAIEIEKTVSNPLCFWKKPKFKWKGVKGYINENKRLQGTLDPYGGNTTANITCCPARNKDAQHKVSINIKRHK